jgi:Protein of unknown function (DUF669)
MIDLSKATVSGPVTIPEGKYNCVVLEAAMKDTKTGTGQYISTTLKVVDGEYAGQKIFHNFNVKNDNPKAVEIGLGQLKSLLTEAGAANPNALESVDQLCGLKIGVKTKLKEDQGYGPKAEVSWFFKTQASQDLGKLPF